MSSRPLLIAALVCAGWFAPFGPQASFAQDAAAAPAAAATTARVIVKYKSSSTLMRVQAQSATGTPMARAHALGARLGLALGGGPAIGDRTHVVMASGVTSAALAKSLASQSDIEYAVPDERKFRLAAPNDPHYVARAYTSSSSGGPLVGQWYMKPPGAAGTSANTGLASINAEQAWDLTTGSSSIVVADIDTGVLKAHADLVGTAMLPGYDFVSGDLNSNGNPVGTFVGANDGDGRDADPTDPGDWVTSAEAADRNSPLFGCTVENSSWHGTQTMGLIGASTDNALGIASVGRNVRLLPVRALGKCGGYDSDILAAMYWAAGVHVDGVPDNTTPARVLNVSLGGGTTCSQAYRDAIATLTALKVAIVVAAGNANGHVIGAPGNCPGVITVTAINHVGTKTSYSDLGPEAAIAAPGGNCARTGGSAACLYPIMTLANAGTTSALAGGDVYTDSFIPSLGTSFSTPLVSGTIALMLSVQPSLTTAEIRSKLQSTARPFPTTGAVGGNVRACAVPTSTSADQAECYCTTGTCGAGMLDAHAAVQSVASTVMVRITVTPPTPTAGAAVALTAADSVVPSGRTITRYLWTLADGGGIVSGFTTAANAATVSATPTAAGTFTVVLTTTDDLGLQASTTASVAVVASTKSSTPAANPPVTPSATPPAAAAGGGGAMSDSWLAGLLAAVLALAWVRRRERALSASTRASRNS